MVHDRVLMVIFFFEHVNTIDMEFETDDLLFLGRIGGGVEKVRRQGGGRRRIQSDVERPVPPRAAPARVRHPPCLQNWQN